MKALKLGEILKEVHDMVYNASIKIQPINFELGERLYNISKEVNDIEVELIEDKDDKTN